jgi:hypothetical protein
MQKGSSKYTKSIQEKHLTRKGKKIRKSWKLEIFLDNPERKEHHLFWDGVSSN